MSINQPLVSISVITFNHAPYIEKCLTSILEQETDFDFEILVHDDASTDGTQAIIESFQKRYPDKIKPVYQTVNQYSQGFRRVSYLYNYNRVKGKYLASCEGDDYWCDPQKMQMQLDALERNPTCSLSFTANHYLFPDELSHKNKIHRFATKSGERIFNIEDVIREGGNFMHTGSMFFHFDKIPSLDVQFVKEAPIGDLPMSLYLALQGDIIYIDKVTTVYRVFTPTSWTSSQRKSLKNQKFFYDAMVKMWKQFDEYTKEKYHKKVAKVIRYTHKRRMINMFKYILVKCGLQV